MILEKYDEDNDNSKRVKVSLIENNGQFILAVVDDYGNALPDTKLLTLMSTGKVFFHYDINKNLGFPLGKNGELKIAKDIARHRTVKYKLVEEEKE